MTEQSEPTGGTGPGHREVTLRRTSLGHYEAVNARCGTLAVGAGDSEDFTPVELLLVAMAGCSSVDVDHITSRRAEPLEFVVTAEGEKTSSDELGNHLTDLKVTFTVRFPDGEAGDSARAMLPRAVRTSHDRLCSVSRTIELGSPVEMKVE